MKTKVFTALIAAFMAIVTVYSAKQSRAAATPSDNQQIVSISTTPTAESLPVTIGVEGIQSNIANIYATTATTDSAASSISDLRDIALDTGKDTAGTSISQLVYIHSISMTGGTKYRDVDRASNQLSKDRGALDLYGIGIVLSSINDGRFSGAAPMNGRKALINA